jgi:hypothetical protein
MTAVNMSKADVKGDLKQKLALVILNKNDWNGAFVQDKGNYESLIDNGYNIIFCEANDESDLAKAFTGYGLVDGSYSSMAGKFKENGKRYDFVLIGGHGSRNDVSLGEGYDEKASLDTGDTEFLGKNWERMMSKMGAICLNSCSTGQKADEQDGNFSNVMNFVGEITNRKVFAPPVPTSIESFLFDANGFVIGTSYYSGTTSQYRPRKPLQ